MRLIGLDSDKVELANQKLQIKTNVYNVFTKYPFV